MVYDFWLIELFEWAIVKKVKKSDNLDPKKKVQI